MKGIMFDVDGALVFRGVPYPGAKETIDYLKEKGIILRFVTSSTLKSRNPALKNC